MTYGVVKALHIISVVAWMAGMLYLPRLFVYHSQLPKDSGARAIFETMERRLLKAIMLPAQNTPEGYAAPRDQSQIACPICGAQVLDRKGILPIAVIPKEVWRP